MWRALTHNVRRAGGLVDGRAAKRHSDGQDVGRYPELGRQLTPQHQLQVIICLLLLYECHLNARVIVENKGSERG